MKWREFKDEVDKKLKDLGKEDIEIFFIDTGNFPAAICINIDEFTKLVIQGD